MKEYLPSENHLLVSHYEMGAPFLHFMNKTDHDKEDNDK